MHQRHTFALMINGVLDSFSNQTLGAKRADGLDTKAGIFKKTGTHLLTQESSETDIVFGATLVLDAGVDVFGVLAEDNNVYFLGLTQR